jgi:hypothetical protein
LYLILFPLDILSNLLYIIPKGVTMRISIQSLALQWKKEFERTTGKKVEVIPVSSVSFAIYYDDCIKNCLKRSDFLQALPILQKRPDFHLPKLPTE